MSEDFQRIIKRLRHDIYSGLRLPRERLVETDLAKAYGVSRMMVRRVLNQLTQEGLVQIEPYRGAQVAEISLNTIYEKYQLVAMLEGYAAKLAAGRMIERDLDALEENLRQQKRLQVEDISQWQGFNRQFHKSISRMCGNQRLVEMIRENARFTSYWFIVLSAPGRIAANVREHRQILRALQKGDGEQARIIVERHILAAAKYLINYLKKNIPIGLWCEEP